MHSKPQQTHAASQSRLHLAASAAIGVGKKMALSMTAAAISMSLTLPHSLLGRRAVLLSSALPFETEAVLALADSVLQQGASVRLIVTLPASGAATDDEGALRLLQMISRVGFPRLMEELGFHWGVAGQYGTGNRPRVDFLHVRADDVETFNLELADTDLLLLHSPSRGRLEKDVVERARWRAQRRTFSFVLERLKQQQIVLRREGERNSSEGVHWAWMHPEQPASEQTPAES